MAAAPRPCARDLPAAAAAAAAVGKRTTWSPHVPRLLKDLKPGDGFVVSNYLCDGPAGAINRMFELTIDPATSPALLKDACIDTLRATYVSPTVPKQAVTAAWRRALRHEVQGRTPAWVGLNGPSPSGDEAILVPAKAVWRPTSNGSTSVWGGHWNVRTVDHLGRSQRLGDFDRAAAAMALRIVTFAARQLHFPVVLQNFDHLSDVLALAPDRALTERAVQEFVTRQTRGGLDAQLAASSLGCFVRAHLLCADLRQSGIPTFKVWAYHFDPDQHWYHGAAAVRDAGGDVWVVDPWFCPHQPMQLMARWLAAQFAYRGSCALPVPVDITSPLQLVPMPAGTPNKFERPEDKQILQALTKVWVANPLKSTPWRVGDNGLSYNLGVRPLAAYLNTVLRLPDHVVVEILGLSQG